MEIALALVQLERTPALLDAWLRGLDREWLERPERDGGWSVRDVLGHLVHGERTDWITRANHILEGRGDEPFQPFDREAMTRGPREPTPALLDSFRVLRSGNLQRLRSVTLDRRHLDLPGLHPDLGPVTLEQLLATWVVHDQSHIAQIARFLARPLTDAVGPWRAYLPMLDR